MQIDPTTMTIDEYRAAQDIEDGRGHLHAYGKYLGMNLSIVDVLDYTVTDQGTPVAEVVIEHRPSGNRWTRSQREVPLSIMFAVKKMRGLGMKPVPWC